MTVAIDELDSGSIRVPAWRDSAAFLQRKEKGSLFSHRTICVLWKHWINALSAFTTTNPQNRYIRMNNVKTTNNLRDFYYRDIVLGEQNEPVYDLTNNSEIAMAFREAGDPDAT